MVSLPVTETWSSAECNVASGASSSSRVIMPGRCLVFMGYCFCYVASGADSSNAASIVAAQIPGELAAAFAFGFAGSINTVAQYGTNQLGNLPSGDWWALTNPVAFSLIQTNGSFYDPYGNVIFNATSTLCMATHTVTALSMHPVSSTRFF